jgi:hypothetical protein
MRRRPGQSWALIGGALGVKKIQVALQLRVRAHEQKQIGAIRYVFDHGGNIALRAAAVCHPVRYCPVGDVFRLGDSLMPQEFQNQLFRFAGGGRDQSPIESLVNVAGAPTVEDSRIDI